MGPVPTKTLALPTHDRVGMDNDEGLSPVFPQHGQGNPKPAVTLYEADAPLVAFVNAELLSKCEIFQGNSAMVFPEQPWQTKEAQKAGEHDA
jgi:hypothetical protein